VEEERAAGSATGEQLSSEADTAAAGERQLGAEERQ